MPTFTWAPDYDAELTQEPLVIKAKFGDGYEQRVADGINNLPEIWSLGFNNRSVAEMAEILVFLRARRGVESFDWTNPEGVLARYICRAWRPKRIGYDVTSISTEFERVFDLL